MDLVALARRWLSCFETKNVDALVGLYAADARHFSPTLRTLRPDSGGCITAQPGRVVLESVRSAPGEPDLPVAEVFEVKGGLIQESRIYHG